MSATGRGLAQDQRRGFYWQDWFAAHELVRCALVSTAGIVSVQIEAAGAGHADDVVVRYASAPARFHQLKHTVVADARYVASDLFGEKKGKASVFRKLFTTHQQLASKGEPFELRVMTNATASSDSGNDPLPPSALQAEFIEPLLDPNWALVPEQEAILDKLQMLAGAATREEVIAFLRVLHLEFGAPSAEHLHAEVEACISRAYAISPQRAATVALAFLADVYDLATRGEFATTAFTADDVRAMLKRRVEVDRRPELLRLDLPPHHIARPQVAEAIFARTAPLKSGYLVVKGPPGSGKTTMATYLADTYPERVLVRYHAFNPKNVSPTQAAQRARGDYFLNELFEALHQRFPDSIPTRYAGDDRLGDATTRLIEELTKLGEQQKWIVIIDGIDHVVRTGLHAHDLFDALPRQLPDNIVFVVFGQPGWNYPKWLQETPSYCVPALDKEEVKAVLAAALGWDSSIDGIEPVADQLLDRTAGNPLSLFYNVQLLAGVGGPEAVAARLPEIELVGPDPRAYYQSLAERLASNLPPHLAARPSLATDILQFCATALGTINAPRLVRAFHDDQMTLRDAKDALAGLRPILVETSPDSYRVFHDDFRRYSEQELSAEAATIHGRHADALADTWQSDELAAFAEHLWLAERDAKLAALPFSRSLDEWLAAGTPEGVRTMHRLALAAALRIGDEALIARTALAVGRVDDVDPDARDELWMLDRAPANAREWLFVLPPGEDGRRARDVRGAALNAACRALATDPDMARTLAARFLVMPAEAPEDDPEYSSAVTRWLLASGQLDVAFGARQQLGDSGRVFEPIEEHFKRERNLQVVETNARAVSGTDSRWELLAIEGAVARIMVGDLVGAPRIVQGLLGGWARLAAVSRRDVFVVASLLGVETPNAFESDGDAWWTFGHRGYGLEPEQLCRLFTLSYVAGRLGRLRDPDAFVFDDVVAESVGKRLRIAGEFICRAGEMVGLLQRNPGLVRPDQLAALFRRQVARWNSIGDPMERTKARYALHGYAPLVALAVRDLSAHAEALAEVLLEIAVQELPAAEWTAASLAEALWILDEVSWRKLAKQAAALDSLPRTDVGDRGRWFDYWVSRGRQRGVVEVERLATRRVAARLGVARKTQPESIALAALERVEWSDDLRPQVRQLLDLLIREDGEPEGGRYFYDDMPELFARLLRHDPGMFADENERFAMHTRIELGGKFPSLVVSDYLDDHAANLTVDDALALWFWVAAAPGSFGDGGEGEAVGVKLAAIVRASSPALAADVDRWISMARRKRSTAEKETKSEDESTNSVSDEAPPELSIDDVRPNWFSRWHTDRENKFLLAHLAEAPEHFAEVCRRLAERVHEGAYRSYELVVLASAMLSVRPQTDPQALLAIGLEELAARVALQPEPPARAEPQNSASMQSVLWRLVALGIRASDVDCIEAALRSLGVAAAIPGMRRDVEAQAGVLLTDEDDFLVEAGLAVFGRLGQGGDSAALEALLGHANACVRARAAQLLGREVEWPDAAPEVAGPALDPRMRAEPNYKDAGRAFYSDPAQVLIRYSKYLSGLTGEDAPEYRAAIERVWRTLPSLPRRPRRSGTEGVLRNDNRVSDAAARYATLILGEFPTDVRPLVLSLVASFDAWQATSHPEVLAPVGWVRLGTSEIGRDARRHWVEHRVLVLMPPGVAESFTPEQVGLAVDHTIEPDKPRDYPWVSSCATGQVRPPKFKRMGALVFCLRPFSSIPNASFDLVPRWDAPLFAGLEYRAEPRPGWHTSAGAPVVLAVLEKENLRDEHSLTWDSHSRHLSGWYCDPAWLAAGLAGGPELVVHEVRLRREWPSKDRDEDGTEPTMSYDLQPVTLPEPKR